MKTLEDRFWEKVDKRGLDDCWEWLASKNGCYGNFSVKHKNILAHRFSWLISRGSIPNHICVCHKCDNPICVNPAHLFLGTHRDNVQDCINKGRRNSTPPPHYNGMKNPCSKLTTDQVAFIRSNEGKTTSRALAKKLGVSKTQILKIWRYMSRIKG